MFTANRHDSEASIHSPSHPLLLEAVCTVLYLASARPGEVVSTGSPASELRLRHWTVVTAQSGAEHAVLQLPTRKTDQTGSKVSDIIIGKTNASICALTKMSEYLKARRTQGELLTPDSFLFAVKGRSDQLRAWSYDSFRATLTAALTKAGYPPELYAFSGHSFRIGAATAMGMHGVPAYWIEDLGGLAPGSRAMRGYLRLSEEARARMTASLTRPHTFDESGVSGPLRLAEEASGQRPLASQAPKAEHEVAVANRRSLRLGSHPSRGKPSPATADQRLVS